MEQLDKYKNIFLLLGVALLTFLVCRNIFDHYKLIDAQYVEKKQELEQLTKLIDVWEGLDRETREMRNRIVFKDVADMKQLVEYSAQKSKVNIISIRPSFETMQYYDLAKIEVVMARVSFANFLDFITQLEDRNISILKLSVREGTGSDDPRRYELSLGGYIAKKP